MTEYYQKQLEEANKYQDFVCYQMYYKLGWPIVLYGSKKSQYDIGESISGVEIKYDKNIRMNNRSDTKLFIETQERVDISKGFTPSGIYRKDNSWIYIIGDYKEIYIFSKKHLRDVFERGTFPEISGKNDKGENTSKGFLISTQYAQKLSIKYINL